MNQIYDGHVIAVLMNELDVDSIDSLAVALRKCNIDTVIESAYKKVFELGLVNTLREQNGYNELRRPDERKRAAASVAELEAKAA